MDGLHIVRRAPRPRLRTMMTFLLSGPSAPPTSSCPSGDCARVGCFQIMPRVGAFTQGRDEVRQLKVLIANRISVALDVCVSCFALAHSWVKSACKLVDDRHAQVWCPLLVARPLTLCHHYFPPAPLVTRFDHHFPPPLGVQEFRRVPPYLPRQPLPPPNNPLPPHEGHWCR